MQKLPVDGGGGGGEAHFLREAETFERAKELIKAAHRKDRERGKERETSEDGERQQLGTRHYSADTASTDCPIAHQRGADDKKCMQRYLSQCILCTIQIELG